MLKDMNGAMNIVVLKGKEILKFLRFIAAMVGFWIEI